MCNTEWGRARRRVRLAAVSIAFLSLGVEAQYREAGTTVFDFLKINYSAREVGMAGASVGMPGGLAGFHANPAVLGYIEHTAGLLSYRRHLLDVWAGTVAGGMPIKDYGFFSINVIDLSGGTIDEVVDDNGLPRETGNVWRDNSVAGGISWGRIMWETLSVGASIKGVYHYMGSKQDHYAADGVALDAGVQYRLMKGRFITGLAIRDLGFLRSNYSDHSDKYSLPLAVCAGLSYVPRYVPDLRLALDVEKVKGDYLEFEPGIEVAVFEKLLFLRGGFSFSEKDFGEKVVKSFRGEADEDYQKSNWSTVCLGLGVDAQTKGVDLKVDTGLEFHTMITPSVVVTILLGI